MPATINQ